MRISDWSSDVCSSDLDALLAAAASIFFEQGYEATRIDDIIERAGGSKRNIYEEFGSKEGLFAAIVTERAERALSALAMDEIRARSLEETLRSEEHTSELQSLMRISYAVFCLKKKKKTKT